jgi:uncharacterized membrane protein YuzA (DUF378 family)
VKIPDKLKSRKFLLTVAVILLDLITKAFGWQINETIYYALLGYLGVEGLVDFAKWFKKS